MAALAVTTKDSIDGSALARAIAADTADVVVDTAVDAAAVADVVDDDKLQLEVDECLSEERLLDAHRAYVAAEPAARSTLDAPSIKVLTDTASTAERWMTALKETPSEESGWCRQRSALASTASSVSASMSALGLSSLTSLSRSSSSEKPLATGPGRTRIYYRCETNTLTVRVETVIGSDLLVPLLSVLNESELYHEWLPRWTTPMRLGVRDSVKVDQVGRCTQLVVITADCPWPLETRQVVLDARAFDDMRTSGDIGVLLQSRDCKDDARVPETPEDMTRIDVEGAFLFRRVPEAWNEQPGEDPCAIDDGDILVTFGFEVDPKLDLIPNWLLNFIVRTVIGSLWGAFIRVAEEVRDGKRPVHAKAIEAKRAQLYDWIDERIQQMFQD